MMPFNLFFTGQIMFPLKTISALLKVLIDIIPIPLMTSYTGVDPEYPPQFFTIKGSGLFSGRGVVRLPFKINKGVQRKGDTQS